jgi:hypothetical protein
MAREFHLEFIEALRHFLRASMDSERKTAANAKPLSTEERKARVAEMAKTANPKVKRGLTLIDFREPTPKERAIGKSLEGLAEKALARRRSKAA